MKWSDTFEFLPLGIAVLDTNFNIVDVNPNFLKTFDVSITDVCGKPFESFIDSRDRKGLIRFHEALAGYRGGLVDLQLVVLHFGKAEHLCRLRIRNLENAWIGFIEDVATSDTFLGQLRLSEEVWKSVISNSTDGVAVLDPKQKFQQFNQPFLQLMDFRSTHGVLLNEEAIRGKTLNEIGLENTVPKLAKFILSSAHESNESFSDIMELGEMVISVQVSPLHIPVRGFVGTCIVIRNITVEKNIENLRLKNAHYSGMSEIATGIIHNAGNILNTINVSIDGMRRTLSHSRFENFARGVDLLVSGDRNPTLLSFVPQAMKSIVDERALMRAETDLIHKRLDVIFEVLRSQQQYAKGAQYSESLALDRVVAEAIELLKPSLRRHDVEVKLALRPVPELLLQKNKLVHILINLINNSKDAVQRNPIGKRNLTVVTGEDADSRPFVTISDNGQGISPEDLQRIFTHGFTTKSEGHGFGLHFCGNAMTEMNGRISVESGGLGKGATFTLVWPAPSERLHG